MKKDKKTEVDPENLDPKNQKKKINLSTMAPALSALLVVACAGASVAAYSPKVYAVQKPSPKTESADTTAEDTAEETALEGQVFDLPDGIYEGTGTGFAGKITVAVEIKDKKIVAITVLNVEADDAAFFNRAKGVIDRIIQSQNLDVDVVSGATYSSRGIISAVKNALTGEKDSGKTAENPGKGEGSTTVILAKNSQFFIIFSIFLFSSSIQHQMTGNTIYHDWLIIALDQWFNIVDKVFGHIICILVHPASRNQLLFIGDSVYIVNSGSCHIWIVRYTVDDYHLAGVSFICCLYGCTANHHSLINIHAGCHMGSASLKSGKLYGTSFAAALCCQEIRQIGGSSLQLLVSKCVHIISYASKLADISSVSQLDSF